MNLNRKAFAVTARILSVAAIVATVLRLATYWLEIEAATGFFLKSGTACILYNVIGFAVFALMLLLAHKRYREPVLQAPVLPTSETTLFTEEEEEGEPDALAESERLSEYPRKIARWQGFFSAFASILPGFGFLSYSLAFVATDLIQESYHLVFAILSALSGAYFIFTAIRNSQRKSKLRAFLALLPAFWCTVRMVVEYRDLTRFINKTLYVGQFLFILSALVFFLYHAQLLLDEKVLLRPNTVVFSALAVVFFGITTRLPQLIAVFGDKVSVDLIDTAGIMIDLAITLYAFIKIRAITEN